MYEEKVSALAYGGLVSLKITVLALPSPVKGIPVSSLVYRAEAYDEEDRFREPKWTCPHRHDSAQAAHECGLEWLSGEVDQVSRAEG
ncbi:MAG TPA: hypothetical protein VNF26_13285 [Candidatus Baltobacterales bacterium]|nr:hypothetical protein [Candidatus Baltobacterales bacterium]